MTIGKLSPLSVLGLVLFLPVIAARAEVKVELSGSYATSITVDRDAVTGQQWSPSSSGALYQVLNPAGDLIGDRDPQGSILALPTVDSSSIRSRVRHGASATTRQTGLVAWSRWDGVDWEIVYSLWDVNTRSWRAPGFVETENNTLDDWDPRIYVHDGLVYLLWRRGGTQTVFVLSRGRFVVTGGVYELSWEAAVMVAIEVETVDGLILSRMLPPLDQRNTP